MLGMQKKEALASGTEVAKQLTMGPIITYAASQPWTSVA
jgi:hypothetical protein